MWRAALLDSASGINLMTASVPLYGRRESTSDFPCAYQKSNTLGALQLARSFSSSLSSASCVSNLPAWLPSSSASLLASSAVPLAGIAVSDALWANLWASNASSLAFFASCFALSAEVAASPACLVKAAISAWLMTMPATSPASPKTRTPTANRLRLFFTRARSSLSKNLNSATSSPITPISTKNAANNATRSDSVNDRVDQIDQTHKAKIMNIQFMLDSN